MEDGELQKKLESLEVQVDDLTRSKKILEESLDRLKAQEGTMTVSARRRKSSVEATRALALSSKQQSREADEPKAKEGHIPSLVR